MDWLFTDAAAATLTVIIGSGLSPWKSRLAWISTEKNPANVGFAQGFI